LGEGQQISLDKAVVFVGRHRDCDVVLKGSQNISRKHCCIAQVNSEFVVRELGSLNGVFVNGKRVVREGPLRIGDEIAFGNQRYVMKATQGQNGSSAAPPPPPVDKAAETPEPRTDLSQDIPVAIPESKEQFKLTGATGDASEATTRGSVDDDEMVFLDDFEVE